MSRRVLIVVWWLVIAEPRTVSREQCNPPNLETCTLDLMSSAADFPDVNWNEIQQIRESNCSLSVECQQALCPDSTTLSWMNEEIGWEVEWESTPIGYRRLYLCPFVYTEKLYAFRDCLVSVNQTINLTASWTEEDASECPLPLFSRNIETLFNRTQLKTTYAECYCSYILTSLSSALENRSDYPDDPVLWDDHLRLMKMSIDWVNNCSSYCNLSTDVLWNATDLLLDEEFIDYWYNDTGVRFLSCLSGIFQTNECSGQKQDYFKGNNIYVYEQMMVGGNISFQFPVGRHNRIKATVNATAPEGTVISNIGSFLIKSCRIPYDVLSNFELYTSDTRDDRFEMVGPLFYIQIQAQNHPNKEAEETASTSISVEVTLHDPVFNSDYWWTMQELRCGRISSDSPNKGQAPMQQWTADDCITTELNDATVLCRCLSPAFVAVFQREKLDEEGSTQKISTLSTRSPANRSTKPPTKTATKPATKPPNEPDMSVFFGFPYVREIYIMGEVFKAISLACLVITVLAFAIYRKARRGKTTYILLNLCVSLIVLIIVLYIATYEASSEMGCRILNVLRYYLALVSLLWNAVEAHNMYRMLVKVFHAETSHFVLIAGFFAWGLPMLAVGIELAVNIEAFDGAHADDCTFKCALRKEMRLFGWIIPMSIIILHNLIVFAMVLNVICRANNLQASGKAQDRKTGQRLCGALTMLVLLGFPWIISVFGLVDDQDNSTHLLQVACSALLVIFVGLQGLFIFVFHCVRNRTIRDLTRKRLSTSQLTLKMSVSRSGVSSTDNSNAITPSTPDVQNSTSTSSI